MDEFKIKIITRKSVPQNIGNPILQYIQDPERKGSRLLCKILKNSEEIGRGIILDFYKEFEIIEGFGDTYTKTLDIHTDIGNKVYKLKYYKNPPLPSEIKSQYIDYFVNIFEKYLEFFIDKYGRENLILSCIPSSSKVPQEISELLSKNTNVEKNDFISINEDINISNKNIEDFDTAIECAKDKYVIDGSLLDNKKTHIIIDDVFGMGASIMTVLDKLYEKTQKKNYFLIIAKDVKR